MPKQPVDENGNPTSLWTSLEDAKRYRAPHYDSGHECPTCVERGYSGIISRKRYVANGECVHCATLNAIELQALATYDACINVFEGTYEYLVNSQTEGGGRPVSDEYVEAMEDALALIPGRFPTTKQGAKDMGVEYYIREVPCRTHGHLGVTTLKGECYYCEKRKTELTPRQEAIRDGKKWYLPNEACSSCGKIAERSVDNGRCRGCSASASGKLSPRQEAIRDGKKWYLPTEPCPKCNKVAEKRVDNGQCRGCTDIGPDDGRETPDSVMMREYPDLVITREDAKAAGLRVYRTGLPCRKGHFGYRYVSTGNCIECLRG